jgi:outer membrane protein assembly factor BamB
VLRFLLLACALSACGKRAQEDKPESTPEPVVAPQPRQGSAEIASASAGRCSPLPFAETSPVPEASGAAWLTIDGTLSLVVISDSGQDGAYAILDPDTGETREQGKLPLGAAGADIEGFAGRGDRIYGLTSSGWLRAWERKDQGFALVLGPNPIGGSGMVCGAKKTNCGRNYEGLCLVDPAHAKGPCVGFVAAKADGKLYCLVDQNGTYVAKHELSIPVAKPGAIADCAFADDGTLWVGSNLFDLAQVYRVEGWDAPKTAKVTPFAQLGIGFPEVIAVRGDVVYRMSDTGGSPSLLAKFRCAR